MTSEKLTLGKAIDLLLGALEPLDEASRETAIIAVCRQLNITIGPLDSAASLWPGRSENDPAGTTQQSSSQPSRPATDIRTLKEQKQPNSAKQMACVVAYYLKEIAGDDERKDAISTADLEKYFKQAGFRLPAKLPQVLVDAKASGYFESVSRGEYKLNAVGHNLVAHNLPSGT